MCCLDYLCTSNTRLKSLISPAKFEAPDLSNTNYLMPMGTKMVWVPFVIKKKWHSSITDHMMMLTLVMEADGDEREKKNSVSL